PLALVSHSAFPGFVGQNVVFAIDSSVVPAGSGLIIWAGNSIQGFQHLGSVVLGNNPMVVTIPSAITTTAGLGITVTAATSSGSSNVIGQIPPSGLAPP